MPAQTTLKEIDFDTALSHVAEGAAFIDLRPVDPYLEVHIPGALCLLYEFGPGMAARARDCLPLSLHLILLRDDSASMPNAAAALRGKGFTVLGEVADGINQWASAGRSPASTDVANGPGPPGGTVLDVGDPGARRVEGATRVVIDKLWTTADDLTGRPVVIVSGYGVRAALAVGILERAGVEEIVFWRTR